MNPEQFVNSVPPVGVAIVLEVENGASGSADMKASPAGTAFLVSDKAQHRGFFVTCMHVIEGAPESQQEIFLRLDVGGDLTDISTPRSRWIASKTRDVDIALFPLTDSDVEHLGSAIDVSDFVGDIELAPPTIVTIGYDKSENATRPRAIVCEFNARLLKAVFPRSNTEWLADDEHYVASGESHEGRSGAPAFALDDEASFIGLFGMVVGRMDAGSDRDPIILPSGLIAEVLAEVPPAT